ncbi:alpha/beta hydrolase [Thalassospira sp. MA62]|nr:alpha/beta hydrolase [Thalassospira sp. MA62]
MVLAVFIMDIFVPGFSLRSFLRLVSGVLVIVGLAACAPTVRPAGVPVTAIGIDDVGFQASDGAILPLQHWGQDDHPRAVVLALHGMGDYANAFMELGQQVASRGIAVYAYDQRGFGRTKSRPYWAGIKSLADDASDMLIALRGRYPDTPVYLLGNSMGGAVAIITAATRPQLMDGVILVAPAVWNRDMMPWYQTAPLAILSHSLPWLPLTGKGLDIWPSDNIEMLRRLSRDPHMMSSVRVDMVAGIADLMDQSHQMAGDISIPVLLLSGAQDQVIPPEAIDAIDGDLATLSQSKDGFYDRCLYESGYHMLLRDLNGPVVIDDIAKWIALRLPKSARKEQFSCTLS